MILNGTMEQDIFAENSGLLYFGISQVLIDTHGREKASKYLWSLYMVYHPESKLYNSKLSDKKKHVMKSYLKQTKEYDLVFGKYVKPFIQEIVNDPVAQMLALVRIKLDEYFDSVAFLNFDVKIKEKDCLLEQVNNLKDLAGYDKMIEEYDKIYKKYVDKKEKGILYKGIEESFREKRFREGKK